MKRLCSFLAVIIYAIIMWNVFGLLIPQGSLISLVDGDSMYPTLKDNQIMFTDASREMERGDIVTAWVSKKVDEEEKTYLVIKRVIAVPGEHVLINETGVYVNGEKLEEDYLTQEAMRNTYIEGKINDIQLGENEYYLMGDNRKVSYDSRSCGEVDFDNITYKQSEKVTVSFVIRILFMFALVVVATLGGFEVEKLAGNFVERFLKRNSK